MTAWDKFQLGWLNYQVSSLARSLDPPPRASRVQHPRPPRPVHAAARQDRDDGAGAAARRNLRLVQRQGQRPRQPDDPAADPAGGDDQPVDEPVVPRSKRAGTTSTSRCRTTTAPPGPTCRATAPPPPIPTDRTKATVSPAPPAASSCRRPSTCRTRSPGCRCCCACATGPTRPRREGRPGRPDRRRHLHRRRRGHAQRLDPRRLGPVHRPRDLDPLQRLPVGVPAVPAATTPRCGPVPTTSGSPTRCPDWVEHYPYQDGLLIHYWDTSQADNDTSVHPGEGLILPVDSHPTPLLRVVGTIVTPWSGRVQSHDATFGLEATEPLTLHRLGVPYSYPGQSAQSVFFDMRQYLVGAGAAEQRAGPTDRHRHRGAQHRRQRLR